MYYVIFVGSGQEIRTETFIHKYIPKDLYTVCFHPTRQMKKKIHGEWVEINEKLIPGYVFVETDSIQAFYIALRQRPAFQRLLGKETVTINENGEESLEERFYPLKPEEEKWLRNITVLPLKRRKSQIIEKPVTELTKVTFGVDGNLKILSGPLTEMTGSIRKIDIHRRFAEVEVEFMGRMTVLHLGIELVNNSKEEFPNE